MCSPSAPDTSRQDAVAAQMQHLTEEQWNWVTKKYEEEKPNRDAASDMAREVSQAQLDQMKKSGTLADESAADYRRIYRPIEEQSAREAANFDSEARQQQAAGRAAADVTQAYTAQRGATERSLGTMGINGSDGAFAASQQELDNQQALAQAGAMTRARDQVQTVGRAMRQDAIGVGRGVVGSQGTQAGLTLTAGANASGTAQVPMQAGMAGVGMVQQGYGQAMSGLQGAGNIYQGSSNMKASAANAEAGGQAALAGAALSAAAIF